MFANVDKVMSMKDAISKFVHDGDMLFVPWELREVQRRRSMRSFGKGLRISPLLEWRVQAMLIRYFMPIRSKEL